MKTKIALLGLFAICFLPLQAKVQLARIFSHHMILQRDQIIRIWGWADPGEAVQVQFGGQQGRSTADADGNWQVQLNPMPAGGPHTLKVMASNTLELSDILMGDIWLCSGQSNMEWTLNAVNNADAEIAAATDTKIRHFKVPLGSSFAPEADLQGGEWVVANPAAAPQFTAVGYFFARHLRENHDVPIGLLNSSWGGSRLEPWMDAATLGYDNINDLKNKIEARKKADRQKLEADMKAVIGQDLPENDLGMQGENPVWAAASLDDKQWKTMNLPGLWETKDLPGLDGIVWYRKEITLDAADAGKEATLLAGKIDDSDWIWVNGALVGKMNQSYNALRKYVIPAGLLQAGKNVIAIRVEDTGGGGGIAADAGQLQLMTADNKIDLSGAWKYKVGKVQLSGSIAGDNQVPTLLYNRMIHPIIRMPIKGVIWYQGESNTGPADAYVYRDLFAKMIRRWRQLWKVGDFPFLYVQLANFMAADAQPSASGWAMLRESQTEVLKVPNTGQAVIIDIGEAKDIHPRNKQDVGLRLGLLARKLAYGEPALAAESPSYTGMSVDGNKIRIRMKDGGSPLEVHNKYGYVNGFAIAGADKKFVWAQARLEGNEVVVWSDAVAKPVAVRYAWGNNPDDVNLYNAAGLPACPFRTDDWAE